MKTITVELVMYPACVTFIMGCTFEEMQAKAKRLKMPVYDVNEPEYQFSSGLHFKTDCSRKTLIWLPNLPTCPITIGYLVHEVNHTVIYFADNLGIHMDVDNHEFFCYANQYLVECALQATT